MAAPARAAARARGHHGARPAGLYGADVAPDLGITSPAGGNGVALDLLNAEQRFGNPSGPIYTLILPAATRWASHFHAFSRLLDVQPSMKACVSRHARRLLEIAGTGTRDEAAREKAEWVLETVRNESFWARLEK